MVEEASRELSSVAEPEGFEINDRRVLTAQEHRLIGSTPEFDPKTFDPFKPQSLFEGSVSPDETIRRRREQAFIVSHSASFYFGFEDKEILRYAVMIELSAIDPATGDVVDREPKLVGIYDAINKTVITDPEFLGEHQLTEAGRQRLLFQEQPSSV